MLAQLGNAALFTSAAAVSVTADLALLHDRLRCGCTVLALLTQPAVIADAASGTGLAPAPPLAMLADLPASALDTASHTPPMATKLLPPAFQTAGAPPSVHAENDAGAFECTGVSLVGARTCWTPHTPSIGCAACHASRGCVAAHLRPTALARTRARRLRPSTSALATTLARLCPCTSALATTLARLHLCTSALATTLARLHPCTSALATTLARFHPCKSALATT